MKTLLTIFTLVFTLMFSSTSFAGWTQVTEGLGDTYSGDIYYVDFERIRKHGGSVYWWQLSDLIKPDEDGYFSYKAYHQGDYISFRVKHLSVSFHKKKMGRAPGEVFNPKNPEWIYPTPNSVDEVTLNAVCSR
jgi:hypothetical protein